MSRRTLFITCLLAFLMITGPACTLAHRLAAAVIEPTPTPPRRLVVFPPVPRSPVNPAASGNGVDAALINMSQPAILPTLGAGLAFMSPLETPTSTPLPILINSAPALPTPTPAPTATPTPSYDFLLGEFFNSPTTNSFLMVYVAIVDPQEIPIGDMKIVGTRLDHNLTYESPLSTWHYEGYSAPGEVVKSGNVKFEPPGGIETTDWVLHLEDSHGNRQSEDVPFHIDQDNKQWYFIKFRRRF